MGYLESHSLELAGVRSESALVIVCPYSLIICWCQWWPHLPIWQVGIHVNIPCNVFVIFDLVSQNIASHKLSMIVHQLVCSSPLSEELILTETWKTCQLLIQTFSDAGFSKLICCRLARYNTGQHPFFSKCFSLWITLSPPFSMRWINLIPPPGWIHLSRDSRLDLQADKMESPMFC